MPEICSIESVTQNYSDANHAIQVGISTAPQVITQSSYDVQLRVAALVNAVSSNTKAAEIAAVLADKDPAGFPIYRDQPDDSDHENTLAFGVFEIAADRIFFSVVNRSSERAVSFIINKSTTSLNSPYGPIVRFSKPFVTVILRQVLAR